MQRRQHLAALHFQCVQLLLGVIEAQLLEAQQVTERDAPQCWQSPQALECCATAEI